jgi:hypothetical protein
MPAADTIVLTRDHALVQLAWRALPKSRTDWRQTFSSALMGITRETTTLVLDAQAGVPMAHLLAALFLDQRPGRVAVVIQAEGAERRESCDPRVRVIDRPVQPRQLLDALEEAASFERDCRGIEALATSVSMVPAMEPQPAIA